MKHAVAIALSDAAGSIEKEVSGITLDAGGLIAIDRNDRRVLILLARSKECEMRITIPATALAQVMSNPAKQVRLGRSIRQSDTDLIALNGADATVVGLLLARTSTADSVDAHVVLCGQRAGQAIANSDPVDLRRIAAGLTLVVF